jgi:hypothetical protein
LNDEGPKEHFMTACPNSIPLHNSSVIIHNCLMKFRAALILIVLFVGACEKHPVSDLQKVDPGALASPAPAAR